MIADGCNRDPCKSAAASISARAKLLHDSPRCVVNCVDLSFTAFLSLRANAPLNTIDAEAGRVCLGTAPQKGPFQVTLSEPMHNE